MIDHVSTKNSKAFFEAYNSPDISYLVLEGGTSSSKTFSAVFAFILLAVHSASPVLISLIAESVPKLKVGMIRDFKTIMADSFDNKRWNQTDRIYTFPSGSMIEFLNADSEEKVKGPRRDHCLIDEANHLSYNVARHVFVRTKGFRVVTHNPTAEYWAHTQLKIREDVSWVHSTFRDALHVLDESIVKEILANKERDPNWWHVYGEGLVGSIIGRVFPDFELIDRMPDFHTTLGLDYGFTNDPTALIEYAIHNDDLYVNLLIYEKGMTNQDIANRMRALGVTDNYMIYYDCAEPKSGEELKREGFKVRPCSKVKNFKNAARDFIKRYNLKITKSSTNLIYEIRNQKYLEDKDGNLTNIVPDGNDHAIDGLIYAVTERVIASGIIKGLSPKY